MKKIFKHSYLLIGFLILFFILKDIDFNFLFKSVKEINLFYLVLSAFMYIPLVFLSSYRFKKIMDAQSIYYSAKNAFYMYGAGLFLSLAVPGRMGDFSKIAYLKKDGHSLNKAFLGNLLDKLFDLFFLALFAFLGIIYFSASSYFSLNFNSFVKYIFTAIFILLFAALFFYFKKKEFIVNFVSETKKELNKFRMKNIFEISLFTVLSLFSYFIIIYFIAASIKIHNIGFLYISFSAVFIIFATIIPVSILGIGTREAALLIILSPLQIPKETIIFFSALIMTNYLSLFLICFFCWLKKPPPLFKYLSK